MANERKPKTSKTKNLEDKVVASTSSTSSAMARKNKGSKKPKVPSSPIPDEHSNSPLVEPEDEDDEEREDEEEEKEDGDEEIDDEVEEDDEDEGEEKNGTPLPWPKSDDFELFKRIRKACPKEDAMKYESRVNHLNWDSIKFQDYSAEQCKNRWLHVQTHLRHYRILAEVLEDAASWVDRPWYNFNKGGKNNQKHPDQPKKPLTSYMLFYMEQKDAVLEKQPGLGMTELSKIIAKMYHELSDRKKTKYSELAEKEKEAYQEKMKKFMDAHPDYILPKSKQTSKAVPPKPPTPFKLFSDEKMPKFVGEGMSLTEAREKCRDAYKELKDKQKLKWIYQALEQEPEFNEEMEKFKMQHPDVDVPAKKLSLLTKDELQIKHKNEGKPDKPPNSGYSLFSKKLLSSNSLKQFETKERMTEISRLWKELSDEDKTSYNDKATQMNYAYKMKYASYLETLTPEQRNAELLSSVGKNLKRMAAKKTEDGQPAGKKPKIGTAADVGSSSEVESEEDVDSDEEDLEIPPKTTIQKPNSSLQMFCNSNMDKYSSKHPKLTKQELTRLMAKEFAKLSEEKKKVYGNMAQKSKNEMSATSKKSASSTLKSKNSKASETSKKTVKPTSATLKSPERSSDSPSKRSAANADSKSAKSPSKIKPSLNANVKSSTEKGASKTLKSPTLAANQLLFKAEKMTEPLKPPASAAAYYVMTHHSKLGNLTPAEIDVLWGKVSEKQKKKCIEEHKKKHKDYVFEFEKFIRTLNPAELRSYRTIMKNRARDQEDEVKESSDEESEPTSSNEDQTSGACSDDDDPQISSDED
ncbi:nucleolar transcription factor 1-like isoform X1 [Daphnia pulex]|uniref:nucleolar transcription factor 1-like isoform X1 n=1 Tax=Daphnia pulex TaxID=6669 RepID=UPI001EDFE1BF|nr:nucleolar transcription factor 1-like isoform X1 [Daphnia pulex]XP_046644663.1 nucleolar transcription factor 1-like isoform X1 [Daphnia pulicaria]XP_046657912.1 nucleolar transcription factor 1-like isoform X1 [Daphnia pulicaria]